MLLTRDLCSPPASDTHNGFLFLPWLGPIPSNASEAHHFPSRTLRDTPAAPPRPESTGWAGAMVRTTGRVPEAASPSQGVRRFPLLRKQGQGLESFQMGDPGTPGPSPSFPSRPPGLPRLWCFHTPTQGYNHVPEPKPAAKNDGVHRTFIRGGGSFSSSPPFHICSLTSSAPSWERTECLSRGGGMGSQQSQEAQLRGWLAARSIASFSPAPQSCKEQGLSPPGNQ